MLQLKVVEIDDGKGDVIAHAMDTEAPGRTLCDRGFDWRLDRMLEGPFRLENVDCPACRSIIEKDPTAIR